MRRDSFLHNGSEMCTFLAVIKSLCVDDVSVHGIYPVELNLFWHFMSHIDQGTDKIRTLHPVYMCLSIAVNICVYILMRSHVFIPKRSIVCIHRCELACSSMTVNTCVYPLPPTHVFIPFCERRCPPIAVNQFVYTSNSAWCVYCTLL